MRLKYIRAKELANLLGVNKSTIWRWVKEKSDFPKPKKISKGVTVWNYWEVDIWVNQTTNNQKEKNMLDEKWIKKVEKNIRREIKIDIDNNEFIEEIFGNYIDKNTNV
ncbi:MAG: AlpA family phage regulatory protein, partial [Turicimonas muris]